MENIQRDLAKEVAALQSSKPTRKSRRWTLLFVGDHGSVITIRWFRWIVTLWALLLVLAVVVSGTLYYLYRHTRNVNVGLQRSLDTIQQQIAGLQRDKEVLMAQLVVAETEREKIGGKIDSKSVEKKAPGDRQEDRAPKESGSSSQAALQSEASVSESNGKSASEGPPDEPVAQENDRVSVEEFNVFHETASNTFRVQFLLRNAGSDSNPVSGYTAVILKKTNTQPDKWLTLPTVKLEAGVPTGNRRGQYFSIARFKTVRSTVKSKIDPRQFNFATAYVFDTDGNLLLEKDFPINIQETVFTPDQ